MSITGDCPDRRENDVDPLSEYNTLKLFDVCVIGWGAEDVILLSFLYS